MITFLKKVLKIKKKYLLILCMKIGWILVIKKILKSLYNNEFEVVLKLYSRLD